MRSSFVVACGLVLAFAGAVRGQVSWNFTGGSGTASSVGANLAASALTAANTASLDFNATSPSSGYVGFSGGNNAVVAARAGAFSAANSTYFEATLTATAGFAVKVSGVTLGTRGTGTGPLGLALYSSANDFANALGATTVSANSTWASVSLSGSTSPILTRSNVTIRIYCFDGSGTAAGNWRIDDLAIDAVAVAAPNISGQPTPLTVASGSPVSFTVAATGTGAVTYQWRKAGAAIVGNTSAQTATLDLGAVTTSTAGSFDVVVTDTLATSVSASATLTVNKAPATVTVGTQTVTYNGAPQTASGTTTSPSSLPVVQTYTATSGTIYPASTTPPVNAGTYTVSAVINHSEYQGTGTGTFTIGKAPAAVTLTPASLSASYDGVPHAATATTTPGGISHIITYNGSTTVPTAAGAYSVLATVNHPNYTGSASGTLTIARAAATLALSGLTTTYTGSPLTPQVVTTPPGQPLVLTYTGINGTVYGPTQTAPTGGGTYSVVAELNPLSNYTATATADFTIGAAPQTLTFAPLPDRLAGAAPFLLAAISSSGLPVTFTLVAGDTTVANLAADTVTLTGATGTVTVRATQPGNANFLPAIAIDRTFQVVASATPPVFIVPPANTAAYIGAPAQLFAHVGGAPAPQLQWRKNGSDVAGATLATLSFPRVAAADAGVYELFASNLAGSALSLPVALEVRKRPQTISFPAPAAAAYPTGTGIPLAITADSGLPVTLAIVSGVASLSGSVLTGAGGDVTVRATQPGNDDFAAAEPVERTFSFVSGGTSPFITIPPVNQTVTAGAAATLRAGAIGNPAPAYQWQKDGIALPGATTTSLTLAATTNADTGRYTIIATNPFGSARAEATLTINFAPVIVMQPESQTVTAGRPITLSVTVSGSPAPTYQWRRNGTAISGATAATFSIASATAANAGRYDVVVTNSLGNVTSAAATLTVDTRDFAGTYFGTFAPGGSSGGDFALHVRANGTGVFLGHLPGLQTGLVATDLRIDANGAFTLGLMTLASAPDLESATGAPAPPTAAAPRPITLRGTIDHATGAVTGSIGELGASFQGDRSPATGPAAARSGFYTAAVIGTATARGYAVIGADGRAYLLIADGTNLDSLRGTLNAEGRLVGTTPGRTTLDVAFDNGTLRGTARTSSGTQATLAGAVDALVGNQHLVNLSVRASTSAATPLITGFVITGAAPKQVLLRAAGPSLAGAPFNVPNAIADPTLQVFRGSQVIAQNDDWGAPAANVAALNAAATTAGAFPFRAGSADAALLTTLAPGAYTVLVGGGNGAALAEIYEVRAPSEAVGARRLVNVSARGLVAPGAPLMAGLVVAGPGPQRVLIRGVGPTLGSAPFNVAGALPNPQLTLFRGTTAVLTNDDWFRNADAAALIRNAATRAAAFPLGTQSLDAAMLLFLDPGAYTVQVSGPTGATANAGGTGIALIEIYESEP